MGRPEPMERPAFDIHQYLTVDDLPPLAVREEVAPEPHQAPPLSTRPRIPSGAPRIPVSFDDAQAWMRQEAERRRALLPPQMPQRAIGAPGLFASPLALEQAQLPRALMPGHGPTSASLHPTVTEGAETDPVKASVPMTQRARELMKRRPKLTAGVGVVAVAGLLLGGTEIASAVSNLGGESAAQLMAEYPTIRNEAIDCTTPAATLTFSSKAVIQIPLTLAEAGHKAYMTIDTTMNTPVAVTMCGVRTQGVPQNLASYDPNSGSYHFDRKAVALLASDKSFNLQPSSARISAPTGVVVDGKALTAQEIAQHPFSKATNNMLLTLMNQDPKTKKITYTNLLSGLVLAKMEYQSLHMLDNPQYCTATQTVADQKVNAYINDQVAKRATVANPASKVATTGKNAYGAMADAYMNTSSATMVAYEKSPVLSLANLTLASCDAKVSNPTATKPTAIATK